MLILVLALMVVIGLIMDFVLIEVVNRMSKDVEQHDVIISEIVRVLDDAREKNRLT